MRNRIGRKDEIVGEIAAMLNADPPRMSTGSTEPKAIFLLANDRLGLGIPSNVTKQEMARRIVEASGGVWAPQFESRGATITREGLDAVRQAVRFFMGVGDQDH